MKADFDHGSMGLLAGQATIDRALRPHPVASNTHILRDLLKTMIVIDPVSGTGAMLLSRDGLPTS